MEYVQKNWKSVVLILTSLPFLIAARWYWQTNPGIWPCVLFWCIALADDPLRWGEMRGRRKTLYGIAFIGALGNAIATLANGGYMPVLGMTDHPSLWVPLTESSRMVWLCDIHNGSSKGDFLIFASLLGLFANWALEKLSVIKPELAIDGKRLPGLGIG